MSNSELLQNLADIADEELQAREEKMERRKNKKKRSGQARTRDTGRQERITDEKLSASSEDMSFEEAVSGKKSVYTPDPDLDLTFDEGESDPFEAFTDEMNRESSALASSAKQKQKNKPGKEPAKLKNGPSGPLGEEITREQAEKVLSNRELGGRRAKIILHTKVVDPEGRPVAEEPEANDPKQAAAEESPQEKYPIFILIREDTGEYYEIDRDLLIGRDDDNDIVIPNPDGHYVSHKHAEITVRGKDVYVKDVGSKNGTYVNDRKIGSKRIRSGDVIEFADIKFRVEQK